MRLMLATILGRSSNRRCSIKSAIFEKFSFDIAEGLRGAVLGGLGHDRILRVHLLHGLFQARHVIDHRKTAPATVASMAQLVRVRPLAQRTVALGPFRRSPVLQEPETEAVSRSGGNALHRELRGQAARAIINREQQTIARPSRLGPALHAEPAQRSGDLKPASGLRFGSARVITRARNQKNQDENWHVRNEPDVRPSESWEMRALWPRAFHGAVTSFLLLR